MKQSKDKEKLIFPGGGTQFKFEGGALRYIEFVDKVTLFVCFGKSVSCVFLICFVCVLGSARRPFWETLNFN